MKQLLVLFFLLCSVSFAQAQDVIVKKDGSTILCHVLSVNDTWIIYKQWNSQNSQNEAIMLSRVSNINYQNGKKDTFNDAHNQYTPGNQNTGAQQYNDRALLRMDYANQAQIRKVNKLTCIIHTHPHSIQLCPSLDMMRCCFGID